ncbi:unnamed protein product [Calicophoron daubneyi]|uniref:Uncharacterized protein n=1 Tax=Calicophoron daubneyi TaxID=300641 RepID=A0AAV2SZX4_CALDB
MFVKISDNLKPHLLQYLQSIKALNEAKASGGAKTILRSIELVSRFGPRKILPPDNILKAIVSGALYHRQQVTMTDNSGLVATIGQLSLVRDVIRKLAEQLSFSSGRLVQDFVLYLAKDLDNTFTYEDATLIPLNSDDYVLDSPIYEEEYELRVRRACWTTDDDFSALPQPLVNFLVGQVAQDFLAGYWLYGSMKGDQQNSFEQCALLSSLLFRSRNISSDITSAYATQLKPKSLIISEDRWTHYLATGVKRAGQLTPNAAKVEFLSALQKWPLFGAACFTAYVEKIPQELRQKIQLSQSNVPPELPRIMVALGRMKLKLFDYQTHDHVFSYPYREIASTQVRYDDQNSRRTSGVVTLITAGGQQLILRLSQDVHLHSKSISGCNFGGSPVRIKWSDFPTFSCSCLKQQKLEESYLLRVSFQAQGTK